MDTITNKIYNAFEFATRLSELYKMCFEKAPVDDICLILKELNIKSNTYFPDLKATKIFKSLFNKWINNLEGIKYEEMWDRTYINLEHDILNLIDVTITLSDTYSETYFKSPNIVESTKKFIETGNLRLKNQLYKMNEQYSNQILFTLMIINKERGVTIFNHNFTEESPNPYLIGGFLDAIQSFGTEISKDAKETAIKKLSYEHFEIQLQSGQYAIAALITSGLPNELIIERHRELLMRFEKEYEQELINFKGEITCFSSAEELIRNIFT
jgi:hypothetical protein